MNWWDHLTDLQHNIQNRTSKKKEKKKKSLVNNYFKISIYAIAVFSGEKFFPPQIFPIIKFCYASVL